MHAYQAKQLSTFKQLWNQGLHSLTLLNGRSLPKQIINAEKPTGSLTHAIDLQDRDVEAGEEVEGVAHDWRSSRHAHSTAVKPEGLTYFTEDQRIGHSPAPWHRRAATAKPQQNFRHVGTSTVKATVSIYYTDFLLF